MFDLIVLVPGDHCLSFYFPVKFYSIHNFFLKEWLWLKQLFLLFFLIIYICY